MKRNDVSRRDLTEFEDENDTPIECYACTRAGVSVSHSTTCDPDHQQEWEALAGSSLIPIRKRSGIELSKNRFSGDQKPAGAFVPVLDPRSESVQMWNRVVLMARGVALAVDPLFFFSLSVRSGGGPCICLDGGVAATVAVVRTCVDAVQMCHLWLQFRLAYVSRESPVVGCGKLVWDARAIASHYLRSLNAFWFDAFVIVPIPQVIYLATAYIYTILLGAPTDN
ncbi:Cyclic nucleotide-gated ion channel 2 [Sarracenia purpurea var. burkii]